MKTVITLASVDRVLIGFAPPWDKIVISFDMITPGDHLLTHND